jgi:tyramine---L-glutamate ligase
MKILVLEYVTGGGFAGERLPPILADAELIHQAQLADLACVKGIELLTMLDYRLQSNAPPGVRVLRVGPESGGLDIALMAALGEVGAVWLTAPETGGVLEALSRRIQGAGCRLLGCAPEAVRVTASKLSTSTLLHQARITSVRTQRSVDGLAPGPVVVKPDDGAGCMFTRCFERADDARKWGEAVLGARAVHQPLVSGDPISLSLLCAGGQAQLLTVNCQQVKLCAGTFEFSGVSVGALADVDGSYAGLASRIARSIPGLWGHVGVDLVSAPGGCTVMEVNPRATVSYAGLHRTLRRNPAAALLDLTRLDEGVPASLAQGVTLELDHVIAPA